MKRSEMIEKLKYMFRRYENAESIAEKALRIIEDNGMLPPKALIYEGKYGGPDKYERKWEKE